MRTMTKKRMLMLTKIQFHKVLQAVLPNLWGVNLRKMSRRLMGRTLKTTKNFELQPYN